MSITALQPFLPADPECLAYLKKWFGAHHIHLKVTRERATKLGDYRKLGKNVHRITINGTLPPQLFFFVLTHELAHLIAFDRYGLRIMPHGKEWKQIFREMLLESLSLYEEELQPIIKRFAAAPKASFTASPDLVRYFDVQQAADETLYVGDLLVTDRFLYRNEAYQIEEKRKKNYLCVHAKTGRKYIFKAIARVEKIS